MIFSAFEDELIKALSAGQIPGAAFAVTTRESLLYASGYGHIRADPASRPVDPGTAFPVASTVKAMTATLLGMLVDEGKVAWDGRVQDYLPRFGLENPYISQQVTLRDLLVMRTGLPAHDYIWIANSFDRSELLERLPFLSLSAGFRERFQYNNLNYAIAGLVAEQVTGQSWEVLMHKRLLEPLGMSGACFEVPAHDNVISSYHEDWSRKLVSTEVNLSHMCGPAGGSLYASLDDMACWAQFNLNRGCVSGRRIISEQTLDEIHTPVMPMGNDTAAPSEGAAYGLGWFVDSYNGHRRVSHTGYLDDVNSCVSLFPDDGVGIVSYVSFASTRPAAIINEHAFDAFLGLEPTRSYHDASRIYEQKIEATRGMLDTVKRHEGTSPSHEPTDYTGRYGHPAYGEIFVESRGRSMAVRWNHLVLALEHWHYDVWVPVDDGRWEIHASHPFDPSSRILFESDVDGEISGFSFALEPEVMPIRFVKCSEPAANSRQLSSPI